MFKFKLTQIAIEVRKLFGESFKCLIYDIETSPLKGWFWRCGEVIMRHAMLDKAYNEYSINTIAYKWLGSDEVFVLTGPNMIEDFDKLVRQADVCIGKNSDNFDVKHINTQRMLKGLKGMPEWLSINDDLEKQLRRYFIFPSMSLDYISGIFGLGGKVKMEMQDWVDIENAKQLTAIKEALKDSFIGTKLLVSLALKLIAPILYKDSSYNIFRLGKIAMTKMIFYNKKDVLDTENILIRIAPHIKLRRNAAAMENANINRERALNPLRCTRCGTTIKDLVKTKKIVVGLTKYQQWDCLRCGQYAGRCTYRTNAQNNTSYGQMQNN